MVLFIVTIISVLAFLLYSGLYIVVTLSKPQTGTRRAFRWYLLAMSLWSFCAFLIYTDQTRALFWFKMMISAGLGTMMSIYWFARSMSKTKGRSDLVVLVYGMIMIVVSLSTDLVAESVAVVNGYIEYKLAPTTPLIAGPGYLLIIISLFTLIRSHKRTNDPIQRNRLLYLILGIAVMLTGSIINFTALGGYPFDIAANGVGAIFIVYAILRYQLLEIRVVIRRGLLYSIPTIIIGAAYFLIITLSLNIFNLYSGIEIFLLSLLVAVVSALVAEPLRYKAQQIIDRMFFREKYDHQVMLQDLSGRVASVLDLYQVTNIILEEVTSTMHIPRAAFLLRDEDSSRFQLTSQVGLDDVANLSFRWGHPIVLWLTSHHLPITMGDVEVLPQFQSLWKSERLKLDELGADLFIPIKVQSKLVGIFVLGTKRSEQAYSGEDRLTLTTVANQTAVAIENARLYTAEQSRRKEIDTLYNLSHQLVATDDLDIILKSVARHAVESIQVTYSRILTREASGDYYCRAIYPEQNLAGPLRLGKVEPIVAEYYYNWVLQGGNSVVLNINNPEWQNEEKQALFINHASTLCICPLKGVDDQIGLLILGEFSSSQGDPYSATELRLIDAIADYAASSIQRSMLHEQLEDNFLQTVVSLANAMDARDSYTGDHSQRMAEMSALIGVKMGLSSQDVDYLHWAGILHDIGKIGVPDEILNKNGPLTKEEWVIMKEHPLTGSQIVAPVKYLAPVAPIILAHHEKFDGSGYPNGLEGDDIPLASRILSVVDAYVAIRDERVYSKAHSHEEAIAELRRFSGTQFDPVIVNVFCKTITE